MAKHAQSLASALVPYQARPIHTSKAIQILMIRSQGYSKGYCILRDPLADQTTLRTSGYNKL